jgi:hypothetical protein
MFKTEDVEQKTIQQFSKYLRRRMPEDVEVLKILEKEYFLEGGDKGGL